MTRAEELVEALQLRLDREVHAIYDRMIRMQTQHAALQSQLHAAYEIILELQRNIRKESNGETV